MTVPSSFSRVLTLAAALGFAPLAGAAPEASVPAKLHPWGLFDPGAWKTVCVVTETLNEQGHVVSTSTANTKTTLVDIDNAGVTLDVQACMEVAGKRFEAEPQMIKQGFHGELLGPNLTLKEPSAGEVVIEGQKIPCKVQQLEAVLLNGKTITTLYYSTTVAPYVLKRESVATAAEGQSALPETSAEVISLDVPMKLRGQTKRGIKMKTVYKSPNGTVTTWANVLPEVPGGVVSNTSQEVDKNGRLVRRSRLELIDYNDDPDKDRTGLFGRKRPPRHRTKPPARYGP
jgi:hypothetical protein